MHIISSLAAVLPVGEAPRGLFHNLLDSVGVHVFKLPATGPWEITELTHTQAGDPALALEEDNACEKQQDSVNRGSPAPLIQAALHSELTAGQEKRGWGNSSWFPCLILISSTWNSLKPWALGMLMSPAAELKEKFA